MSSESNEGWPGVELYEKFLRESDDHITHGRWYSINVSFKSLINIGYRLHSFGDDVGRLSEEEQNAWAQIGGVDGFLEFESHGRVTHPDPFAGKGTQLLVNPLSSRDRFQFIKKGSLGDGWYDGTSFLVRIYLDMIHTQQLLSILKDGNFQQQGELNLLGVLDRTAAAHDSDAINIRFDLFNLEYQEKPKCTSYEICRVYI